MRSFCKQLTDNTATQLRCCDSYFYTPFCSSLLCNSGYLNLLHTDGGLLVPDGRDARKRFEELEETLRVLEEEKASSVSLKRGGSDCDISR